MKLSRARELRAMIEKASASLTDTDALDAVELFPAWETGKEYETGDRFRYDGQLYKVRQGHTSQAQYTPDMAPALYELIAEPGQGDSPSNPIPYSPGMALIRDKYYSENGVVYVCIRGSGIPVYNALADLVHNYVEVVE